MNWTSGSKIVLTALALMGGTSAASAAVVISGNECGSGGFSECTQTINGNVTPAIVKFNSNFEVSDTSTLFPSITGDEFSFFDVLTSEGEVEGASFSYTLGAGDPGITGFAVFSAGDFLLYDSSEFTFDSGVFSGSFTTQGLGNNPNNPTPGLSHITFFDTAAPGGEPGGGGEIPAPIPLPAGGLLMLTGLAGLAAVRRKLS